MIICDLDPIHSRVEAKTVPYVILINMTIIFSIINILFNVVSFLILILVHSQLSKVRVLALEVVVRTHFLNQLVIDAKEGDENADYFERFGTEPGSVGLGVLCEAGLGRIVQAGFGFLGPVSFLILHAAVKGLCLFGVNGGLVGLLDQDILFSVHLLLLLEDLKLHHFGWRHNADGHIAQAG